MTPYVAVGSVFQCICLNNQVGEKKKRPLHVQPHTVKLILPPLTVTWLKGRCVVLEKKFKLRK